jgi:hypothetical protein
MLFGIVVAASVETAAASVELTVAAAASVAAALVEAAVELQAAMEMVNPKMSKIKRALFFFILTSFSFFT